ncbi:MAG: pyridoxamine 5'-phosphate oxidase family protein [Thermaerobacter sp.]|jgi:hypothetical protein|nr:pyridoxamine 5'-phosphate oxidase family protein [Thermaerobacter sp.]
MAVVTQEMKDALRIIGKGGSVVHLATCSRGGKPNIVAERFVTHYKDEYILIADMFAQKTKVNLNENQMACISVAHPMKNRAWVFRGPCTILTLGEARNYKWHGVMAGPLLDEWGSWDEKEPPDEVPPDIRPPRTAQRGVIVLKVEEVYSWLPDEAGRSVI